MKEAEWSQDQEQEQEQEPTIIIFRWWFPLAVTVTSSGGGRVCHQLKGPVEEEDREEEEGVDAGQDGQHIPCYLL